jgi:hypothetical protein
MVLYHMLRDFATGSANIFATIGIFSLITIEEPLIPFEDRIPLVTKCLSLPASSELLTSGGLPSVTSAPLQPDYKAFRAAGLYNVNIPRSTRTWY